MMIRGKVLALGAAGVVALGGAGLYAGSLSVSSSGSLGAGEASIQASCASAVDVTPGNATWNSGAYTYSDVTLAITENGGAACDNKTASVTVYTTQNGYPGVGDVAGDALADGTATISSNGQSASVSLTPDVDAGLDASKVRYAVVIQ